MGFLGKKNSSSDIVWRFDPPPVSGFARGGNPLEQILQGKDSVFVREAVQNPADQLLKGSRNPVRIVITVHELSGATKEDFLNAAGWSDLKKHVTGCAANQSTFSSRLISARDRIDSTEPLRLVSIEDYGTYGLLGAEDDLKSNFALLCKADFITNPDPERTGSFGLGKGTLWRHSGISTVLFASVVESPTGGKLDLRLFGRSVLSSHSYADDSQSFDPNGFFGKAGNSPNSPGVDRSESVWGNAKMAADLLLDRPVTAASKGATALIIDFHDPESDAQLSMGDLLDKMDADICKWFWPGLISISGKTAIEITLKGKKNNKEVKSITCDPDSRWKPFTEALTEIDSSSDISAAGDKCSRTEKLDYPAKKDASDKKVTSVFDVRIKAKDHSWKNHDFRDHVALLRKNMMVVEYLKIPADMSDDLPVFGAVAAGLSRGDTPEDKLLHQFLRDSEPPLHDNWRYRDVLSAEYFQGGGAAQDRLYNTISTTSKELALGKPDTKGKDIPMLSKHFKFGVSGSSDAKRSMLLNKISHVADPKTGRWNVKGRILNQNYDPDKAWTVEPSFMVRGAGESGVKILSANSTTAGATHSYSKNKITLHVDGDDQVDFEVSLELDGAVFSPEDISRVVLEVRI